MAPTGPPTPAASSSSATTWSLTVPWSGPSSTFSAQATTAYGLALVDAATRAPSVEVASS